HEIAVEIDPASGQGDASAALGRDAAQPVEARVDRPPGLGQQWSAAPAEREDRADVVRSRQVTQPIGVIERLERAAAPLGERERSVDEGQRETPDRDDGAWRDGLAREPA